MKNEKKEETSPSSFIRFLFESLIAARPYAENEEILRGSRRKNKQRERFSLLILCFFSIHKSYGLTSADVVIKKLCDSGEQEIRQRQPIDL